MFKSVIISFVYLTYHLTYVRTKLYTFCISPAQNQLNNVKTTLHKALFLTSLCYFVQLKQKVQSLMKTLTRTKCKSI